MPGASVALPLPVLWAVEPGRFQDLARGQLAAAGPAAPRAGAGGAAYHLSEDGIATIGIEGVLTKGGSEWGMMGTVDLRRAVRQAAADPAVKGIMLLVDSPGGTVAGTAELAADVAAAARLKPLHAHAEDLCASAAYWVASQGARFTATPTSLVGSIGTYAAVVDFSRLAANLGLVVHVISTGAYKGAFVPGTPVSEDQLAYLQSYVDGLNEHFLAGVAGGRGLAMDAVRKAADGRIHLAAAAQGLGLIDAVESQDQAMRALRQALSATVPVGARAPAPVQTDPVTVGEAASPGQTHAVAADLPGAAVAAVAAPEPREQPERVDAKARHVVPDAPPAEAAAPAAIAPDPGASVPGAEAFTHNSKTAAKEPAWGDVDKTRLPRVAFAEQGEPGKKSTWGYPHHWVENGGDPDKDGCYTTGTLWLHESGLAAARSAAEGGRSGQKASQAVRDHLAAHRAALDKGRPEQAAPQPEIVAPVALEGPVPGRREVVVGFSLSDRATVEAEMFANLARFTDAFGPEGATWFAAGKTFDEAQTLHAAAAIAERDRLALQVADLKARLADGRGSPSPVSFSAAGDDSPAAAASRDLESKIGKNLARVAAGMKFARK